MSPLSKPSFESSRVEVERLRSMGKTPIGEAVRRAQVDLDASGFSRRHILVVTDGENTTGVAPEASPQIFREFT